VSLPQRARVEAAPNFLTNLEAVRQFLLVQDAAMAATQFAALRAQLREMLAVLAWAPAGGRPARFLAGRSVQARLRSERVQAMAAELGLPGLREYVLGRHVVLYAHSADEVVLLAIKHQRQLNYLLP